MMRTHLAIRQPQQQQPIVYPNPGQTAWLFTMRNFKSPKLMNAILITFTQEKTAFLHQSSSKFGVLCPVYTIKLARRAAIC